MKAKSMYGRLVSSVGTKRLRGYSSLGCRLAAFSWGLCRSTTEPSSNGKKKTKR